MEKPAELDARPQPPIEDAQSSEPVMLDEQYAELMRVTGVYKRQAEKCATAGAYLAGCIMIGAALEAALLAICDCYYDDIPDELKPRRKKRPLPVIEWDFFDLMDIARELNWLPVGLDRGEEWSSKKAAIGDYAEEVRRLRNLVHPACYVQEMPRKRITERYYDHCQEVYGACIDYLLDKIGRSLKDAVDKEESEGKQV